jgi:hypothetical protein
MRCTERIVFAFGSLGEAGQATALPQRADTLTTVCENLVRISLMSDVPDQPIGRCVEHVMQRYGQFDHTKAGAKMASRNGDGINGFPAQFVGDLP